MICCRCGLASTRTTVVFGVGNPERPLLALVGEGPGANEDKQGVPFIGKAGGLLDKMLAAMLLKRENLYICNAVQCRPPENRKPESDEIKACSEFLIGQLRVVRPHVVLALGGTAIAALCKQTRPMKELRGRWFEWEGIPVRATYHPAYLLREPSMKKAAWEDLQAVIARLQRDHMVAVSNP